jgi:hypothetical protein
MGEPITREEYNASIGRIHDKVEEIKTSVIRTEESVKHSENFMKDMHKLLYGNGSDGWVAKVDKKFAQLFERVGLHSKILVSTLLIGSLGAVILAVWRFIVK